MGNSLFSFKTSNCFGDMEIYGPRRIKLPHLVHPVENESSTSYDRDSSNLCNLVCYIIFYALPQLGSKNQAC